MSYEVKTISDFENQAKRLIKKIPSLKKEIHEVIQSLKEDPRQGDSFGNSCYKVRIKIASKGKGKSGGARLITHVLVQQTTVYLLSIYDKSEHESMSEKHIK